MKAGLRILLATTDIEGRGANFVRAWQLGRALAGAGHAVTLLAGAPSPSLRAQRRDIEGVELVIGPAMEPKRMRRSGWGPLDMLGRLGVLRHVTFDVVHIFGHRPSAWLPLSALRARPAPLVVADWADWYGAGGIAAQRSVIGRATIGRADDWLERRIGRWASGITVVTRTLEAMAVERGFPGRKALRLTAGADTRAIVPLPKGEARIHLGLDPERPVVMNCGLSAWDRPNVLAVFSEIARRHRRAQLVSVGAPSRPARRLAERAGWVDRLVQLPHVPHAGLGPILAAADVVVLPFPLNGMNLGRFPNQAADAMAAGRPIVTNPTGDLGEFIHETRAGVLTEDGSQATAQGVVDLLQDRERADELGGNGRRAATDRLAWPLLAETILTWYRHLD